MGLLPSPLAWCVARELFEDRGKVRLRLETDAESDIDESSPFCRQHLLSTLDAFAQNIVVRSNAGGRSELADQ